MSSLERRTNLIYEHIFRTIKTLTACADEVPGFFAKGEEYRKGAGRNGIGAPIRQGGFFNAIPVGDHGESVDRDERAIERENHKWEEGFKDIDHRATVQLQTALGRGLQLTPEAARELAEADRPGCLDCGDNRYRLKKSLCPAHYMKQYRADTA